MSKYVCLSTFVRTFCTTGESSTSNTRILGGDCTGERTSGNGCMDDI